MGLLSCSPLLFMLLLAFFASSPSRKCIRVSCFLRVFLTLGFHVFEGILDIRVSCFLRVFLTLGFHVFESILDIRVSCF